MNNTNFDALFSVTSPSIPRSGGSERERLGGGFSAQLAIATPAPPANAGRDDIRNTTLKSSPDSHRQPANEAPDTAADGVKEHAAEEEHNGESSDATAVLTTDDQIPNANDYNPSPDVDTDKVSELEAQGDENESQVVAAVAINAQVPVAEAAQLSFDAGANTETVRESVAAVELAQRTERAAADAQAGKTGVLEIATTGVNAPKPTHTGLHNQPATKNAESSQATTVESAVDGSAAKATMPETRSDLPLPPVPEVNAASAASEIEQSAVAASSVETATVENSSAEERPTETSEVSEKRPRGDGAESNTAAGRARTEPAVYVAAADVRLARQIQSEAAENDGGSSSTPIGEIAAEAAAKVEHAVIDSPRRPFSIASHDVRPAGDSQEVSRVDTARFVGRVTRAFHFAQERGGTLQRRLSPPERGSLKLELSVKEGVLNASLEAETPAARRLLLDNLPALRERLAEQNVRVERFDVDVRREGQDARGSADHHGQQDPSHREDRRSPTSRPASKATRGEPPSTQQRTVAIVSSSTEINLVV